MDRLEAMTTTKKPLRGAPVQEWFDEEEARTPGFIEKIDAMNLRERVAKDLRALREGAGLTQAQLAQRLGVTQPVVAKIESGKTMPDLMTVHRFAHGLGYLVDPPSYRPMPGREKEDPSARGKLRELENEPRARPARRPGINDNVVQPEKRKRRAPARSKNERN
jgi:transcriptional regulator with XRE-family HTH domain